MIRVSPVDFKRKRLVGVRVYYHEPEDKDGIYKPSPKGIIFNPGLLPALRKAISALESIQKGWKSFRRNVWPLQILMLYNILYVYAKIPSFV